ncbi:MAG TPA: CoA pyrophosphatase [Thermodesulfobacteriota bacterium]|nr:CoA pyrophosphatase [Thermodesulfobacteriota bacterium]
MQFLAQENTIDELEKLLKSRVPVKIDDRADFVHAAVMMILGERPEGLSLLFIKRPESDLDAFSGHMAFPGGKMKEGDESKLATAIRETHEEIGVDLNTSGHVLGELDDINPNNPRARNFIVTPYLSVLREEVAIVPNLFEVEASVWVPVKHLLDEKNFAVRMRERNGKLVEDYVYSFGKYIIWGMTGRILQKFFSISSHLF